jgi:serine phosphatase RsbU (regulator of sigma subunit)
MDGTWGIERPSVVSRRQYLPLALTLALVALVVALLVAGGLYVRSVVATSFRDAERIRTARLNVTQLLNEQLDEETGVRGYAVARMQTLLEPYYTGRAILPASFERVYRDLTDLNVTAALRPLGDAVETNRRWLRQVAFPVILSRRPHPSLELRGKSLVDRFRRDLHQIDGVLAGQASRYGARVERAIVLVGALALGGVFAVIVAASLFTIQQYRLGVRLERARTASEEERRKSAEVRAAYATEKRIADTLQQAFAERLFPELPSLGFSATYMPATEQAKIGGDWYDALQLSEDRVLLAIGDVTGHGIEAVVAMNKARQLLIGCALLDATPHRVLERVNAELMRSKSPIITAVSAVIDTRTREFAYAAAGHPPPVLFEPGGRARLLEFGSLPLGVTVKVRYVTHRVQTVPDAMIVLYTDGAIEHSRDLASGEAELVEAVEAVGRNPDAEPATAIRDRIFKRRKVADDVAILTARFSSEPTSALPRRIA